MNEAQLPPGHEVPRYHNPDNLLSAGEPPWRFTIEGENPIRGEDEYWRSTETWDGDITGGTAYTGITYRTRRPLPAIPEPSVPAQGEEKLVCSECGTEGIEYDRPCPNCGSRSGEHCRPIALGGNPSPVAPSGGEEEKAPYGYHFQDMTGKCHFHLGAKLPTFAQFGIVPLYTQSSIPQPSTPPPAEAPTPRPLEGEWRANEGYLCCGTLRIARADFDTDPSPEFRREVFEWMASMLNNARTTERELSAMRQEREGDQNERNQIKAILFPDGLNYEPNLAIAVHARQRLAKEAIADLRSALATVTAERDALKWHVAGHPMPKGPHGQTMPSCEICNTASDGIALVIRERDTALASAESARKDGERLDWLEAHWKQAGFIPEGEFEVGKLRSAIDAARLTSEGGR